MGASEGTGIPSMGKVFNLGHKALEKLFDGPVTIQEKVDGSQISWLWTEEGLFVRSKGSTVYTPNLDVQNKMFGKAVEHLLAGGPWREGVVFRGEYLQKPKHNTLAYERIPRGHIALFDAFALDTGQEADRDYLQTAADMHGIELVPQIAQGTYIFTLDDLKTIVEGTESFLGGAIIEGIVIKNYAQADPIQMKYPLMGKYVRESFKEKHQKQWKKSNPGYQDIIGGLLEELNTERRYEKAVEHLRDAGRLQDAPQDIGPLMKEVKADVLEEEEDYIKDVLYQFARKEIERGLGRGLPEWYKERLARQQFTDAICKEPHDLETPANNSCNCYQMEEE